jgi:hypothetical protein
MKKPVKRVILLEESLFDLMEDQTILASVVRRSLFQAFITRTEAGLSTRSLACAYSNNKVSGDTSQKQTAS